MDVAKEDPAVLIHQNVWNMWNLCRIATLQLQPGGTTTYERCACGVPSVCFSWTDNQVMGVDAFSKSGLMIGAGDIRGDVEGCVSKIVKGLKVYCADYEMRVRCGERLMSVVDGVGEFVRF